MKKTLFAATFTLLLGLMAQSQVIPHYVYIPQYYSIPSGSVTPWQGHSLVSLHAGTGVFDKPDGKYCGILDYAPHVPFDLAFRYAAEKDFATHFYWGWHSEIAFQRYGYDFTYNGDSMPSYSSNGTFSGGHNVDATHNIWTLSVDEGLLLGCNIGQSFSVNASAGFFFSRLGNCSITRRFVDRTTGAVVDEYSDNHISLFDFSSIGFSFRAEVQYFFSGCFFASLAGKVRVAVHEGSFDDPGSVNHYSLFLGVGYKTFRKKSSFSDD